MDKATTWDLDRVAAAIKSGEITKIAFLTGAGISVSAGIPDFRSPGGMYDTLRPDLLTATENQRDWMRTDPTSVVSWPLFKVNQLPYLELRRPFILGLSEMKWKATLAHWFISVCHQKGVLQTLYTQNIDGLDYQTTIPKEKIIGVHGSLGVICCEFCKNDHPMKEFQEQVKTNIKDIYKTDPSAPAESTTIPCSSCGKPGLKPKTVLYGSALPTIFFEKIKEDFPGCVHLLIVVGTSLTVGPANLVVGMVDETCPRLIVNNEKVGEALGVKYGDKATRDVFSPIGCDESFLLLAEKLGWVDDLKAVYDNLAPQSQQLLDSRGYGKK